MISEDYLWQIPLRLKLRQTSGDYFQDFFSSIMGKVHGDDFVKVRPFGSKGDKGCDGYLLSSGQLFQCYGALNGDKGKVDYLISKMDEDFGKAKDKLGAMMKEWHMVHNLVDGLPVEAVEKLNELKEANPDIQFGFIGLEGFEERVDQLTLEQKNEILGPIATNGDALNLQVDELKSLIDSVIEATETAGQSNDDISPVSQGKLDGNHLPEYWKSLVSSGWQNAHVVVEYFDKHHDPMRGEMIAGMFNEKYLYLKSQNLSPASIMDGLYEFVTGIGSVSPARQVAAHSLLAHLFESCDIFENIEPEGEE
jgi:hypothetical protein